MTGQQDEIPSKEGCLRSQVRGGYSALWPRARPSRGSIHHRSTTWKPESPA
jgi:hypothetical protein